MTPEPTESRGRHHKRQQYQQLIASCTVKNRRRQKTDKRGGFHGGHVQCVHFVEGDGEKMGARNEFEMLNNVSKDVVWKMEELKTKS